MIISAFHDHGYALNHSHQPQKKKKYGLPNREPSELAAKLWQAMQVCDSYVIDWKNIQRYTTVTMLL